MKQSDSGLFFIQLPPPFEKQTLWEMEQKGFPTNQAKIFKGGIEIELPLQMGFSMNHSLKTPNRILLRLASFKCRDFPKLYKNAQKIPWNQILRTEKVKINSTSKKSRLIHTDRINQTMEDAIEKFFIAQPQKKQFLENPAKDIPEVFVRIIDDECTISIDTSGERLSKRGREIQASSAPLRENLAACLLTKLLQEKNLSPTLIDPCCGSGTFLKEARDYFKLSKRNFAYQDFPFLRTPLKINENHNKLYEKLMGRDLIEPQESEEIDFAKEDLFENLNSSIECDIICNLPYGQRIKLDRPINDFWEQIATKYDPNLLGLLMPSEFKKPKIENYKLLEQVKTSNGGIDVTFYLLMKK